jgi:threonylcarbamoyladenosine tRNA methylthiotransferase MtaB
MYKIAFETFGCRLNQAETATLTRQFMARGYELSDDPLLADLYVVNTCNLTSAATAKCRRKIRSVIRSNPDACVAAIGCYAQTDAENLKGIDGLDYIVGTSDKLRLADIIPVPVKLPEPRVVNNPVAGETFTIDEAGHYPWNTRANIKVQEGCDFVCSFCIVPRSRGRARSREFGDIVKEARLLVASGHRELVVTGVNMGTYRDGGYRLSDVLRALAGIDGLDRIRLSSIEPTTIDDDVVAHMAEGGKLCPYAHVPAQSGDDGVLSAMRRRYDSGEFRRFLDGVVSRVPGVGLGTDIMVGFPGEDEAAFENSCELMRSLPFTNIHVFSFSARPRTSAWNMPDKLPAEEIRARSAAMHRIADMKKAEFYAGQEGRAHRVLFEERDATGSWIGFTDNYVRTAVNSSDDLSNRLLGVRMTGVVHTGRKGSGAGLLATGELLNP